MIAPRRRLTPHQRETLLRLARAAAHRPDGWVRAAALGSRGALDHLVDKGYAVRRMTRGPMGGEHPEYRPTPAPPAPPSTSSPAAPGEHDPHHPDTPEGTDHA